jgi:hypothetical protein
MLNHLRVVKSTRSRRQIFKKLLVDQIVTISKLTRRRRITQVRVLVVHHGDSLIQKLVLITLDVSCSTAGVLEGTVSRRPVHYILGA